MVLDAGHPADKELLVGSSAWKKRLGIGECSGIRHDPARSEGKHGVGEGGLRIRFGGASRQNRGLAVNGVFIVVYCLL